MQGKIILPASGVDAGALDDVRRLIRERERRYRYFDAGLFSDPAWDILLELFLADLEGRQVPVTNLCCAANAPDTTVLRWTKLLDEAGMIIRVRDRIDKRRVLVRLSPATRDAMAAYVEEQRGGGGSREEEGRHPASSPSS